jgi:hypothetical protein
VLKSLSDELIIKSLGEPERREPLSRREDHIMRVISDKRDTWELPKVFDPDVFLPHPDITSDIRVTSEASCLREPEMGMKMG